MSLSDTQSFLDAQAEKVLDTLSVTTPPSDDETLCRLALLSHIEYDKIRDAEAKRLGIRVSTLDAEVIARRPQSSSKQDDSPFPTLAPWPDPIQPAALLDEITRTIQRFIVLEKHQAQMAALWVSACWFLDVIQCAPIALINAPTRACGKTQLLTVLAKLAPRTAQASGISPSVLFRMIEAYQPTLFVDEIETVLQDNLELMGLINAGHTRDSAYVWRSVPQGDDFVPKRFTVWGMKALAGINAINLAETVTSRAIVFELRRKKQDERVDRLRRAEAGLFETLAAKLARFAQDYLQQVGSVRPDLPDQLGDREQDNLEPLLQVAYVAGDHWPDTAIQSALKLSGSIQTPVSSANELLQDIYEIWSGKLGNKMSTAELISLLCADDERSWGTWNRGKPLTPRQLSKKLQDYGITSKTIRINSYETAKGFEREQFDDAFARYLLGVPRDLPSQGNNSLEANNDGLFPVTDEKSVTVTEIAEVTRQPAPMLDCDSVTAKTGNEPERKEIEV